MSKNDDRFVPSINRLAYKSGASDIKEEKRNYWKAEDDLVYKLRIEGAASFYWLYTGWGPVSSSFSSGASSREGGGFKSHAPIY